jgi:hypothetical protein
MCISGRKKNRFLLTAGEGGEIKAWNSNNFDFIGDF